MAGQSNGLARLRESMPIADLRWAGAPFVALAISGTIMKVSWGPILSVGAYLARLEGTPGAAAIEVETGSSTIALSTMAIMLAIVLAREIAPNAVRLGPAAIAAIAIALCQVVAGFLLLMVLSEGKAALSALKIFGSAYWAGALAATFGLLPMIAGSLIWWAAFRYIGPSQRAPRASHADHP
jgi:hypothetical protein